MAINPGLPPPARYAGSAAKSGDKGHARITCGPFRSADA
jgi:hypothetical protein